MNAFKKAIRVILQSKILTITCVGFLGIGMVVGVIYFPPEWSFWQRLALGFGAGLMATLYAVGNHLLMEMDDSVNEVDKKREAARKSEKNDD